MPSRADAIAVCSCGTKWGNARRASLHEDLHAVEQVLIAVEVPRMVRHYELGHTLTFQGPSEFAAVIRREAERLKKMREAGLPAKDADK